MSNDGTGKPVAVRIAGHEYKIRSDGDGEALREIAGYVDRAMNRVRERTGTVDTLDVAVLTCLNLAREILALHDQQKTDGATVVEAGELQGLIDRVESMLTILPEHVLAEKSQNQSSDSNEAAVSEAAHAEYAPARTVELPTVEALRERAGQTARAGYSVDPTELAHEELAAPRVAAGGRDRAS
ncbi:cell division protein ZapA [Myxococcota bacterium]|nr:cell division protein ZapA [Myxococcota bacterium]